jgi:hypothetical protein
LIASARRRAVALSVLLLALCCSTAFASDQGALAHAGRTRRHARVTVSFAPRVILTGSPVAFRGRVFPRRAGERVALQRLTAEGHWRRLTPVSFTTRGGSFVITHVFQVPSRGALTVLRVELRGRRRVARAFSKPFEVTIRRPPHPHRHPHRAGRHLTEPRHPIRQRRAEERRARKERRRHERQLREAQRRHHHALVVEERRRRRGLEKEARTRRKQLQEAAKRRKRLEEESRRHRKQVEKEARRRQKRIQEEEARTRRKRQQEEKRKRLRRARL